MTAAAFFTPDGTALIPQAMARSFWGPTLHGRLIGGLCAREVEAERADDLDLVCARLTVELFRSARLDAVEVRTKRIRKGKRIVVLETTVLQEGSPIGQGKAVLLRRGVQPAGEFVAPPAWAVPPPSRLGAPTRREPSADGFEAPWDMWAVEPLRAGAIRGDVWIRDRHDLVAGEPITPLVRVALAADAASPAAHTSTLGLGFINADYTMYLMREPVGEPVGIQRGGHLSHDGVAVGQCMLHDQKGNLGFVATAALANPAAVPYDSGRHD